MKIYKTLLILLLSIALFMFQGLPMVIAKPDIKAKVVELNITAGENKNLLEAKIESIIRDIENRQGFVRNVSIVNSKYADKLLCVVTYEIK